MSAASRALSAEQRATVQRLRREATQLIEAHTPPLLPLDAFEADVLRIDEELVRFLRSNVWKFDAALNGVLVWLEWRREYRPAQIRAADCDEAISRSGVFFFHGYDRLNHPLCYLNIRLVDQNEGSLERRQRYIIWQVRNCRGVCSAPRPLTTRVPRV